VASGPAALLHRRRPLATPQLSPPGLTGPTGGLASRPLPAKAPPNEPATGRETNCPGVFERHRPWFARPHCGSADRQVFPSGYWSNHLSSPFVFAAVRSVLDRPQWQADPLLGRAADRAVVPCPPVCVDIRAFRCPLCHVGVDFLRSCQLLVYPGANPLVDLASLQSFAMVRSPRHAQ
jgi:hypothetical protein